MTFSDLIKIKGFIDELNKACDKQSMKRITVEIEAYLSKERQIDSADLKVNQMIPNYTNDVLNEDKLYLRNFLEAILNSTYRYERVSSLYDLYMEGMKCKDNNECFDFLRKAHSWHIDGVKIDKNIIDMLNGPQDFLVVFPIDYIPIKDGVCAQLKNVCSSLMEKKIEKEVNKNCPVSIEINNSNNNNNKVSAEISIDFNEVKRQIEDLSLSDNQTHEILMKIDELESLSRNEKSKKKIWERVKDVVKWVTEQGIQVAGVLLPLLGNICK